MLDIWKHVTELSFRGFGKRKRKTRFNSLTITE